MININEVISYYGAERCILTIVIQNTEQLVKCEELGLKKEHFSLKANRYIYSSIANLLTKGYKIDSVSIMSSLDDKAKEEIHTLGGMEYLDTLITSDIEENLGLYVDKVVSAYKRRQTYKIAEKLLDEVVKDNVDLAALLDKTQNDLLGLSLESSDMQKVHKMGDGLMEKLEERANKPTEVKGYKVGWKNFDKITQGYQGGELTVYAAPSKTGKTVILMNHAATLSVYSNIPVLYISTEMLDNEIEDRLLSCISGVNHTEITNGMFAIDTANGKAIDKMRKIKEAVTLINSSKFYHVYMPNFDSDKISALTKQYNLQGKCDCMFFDYIKLPNEDVNSLNSAQEYQRLGYLTTKLKDLAGILNIPVVTACQTNADNEQIVGKPNASHIGGSKRILHMASKLFFLTNKKDEELARNGLDNGNQTLWIAFQRSGSSDVPPINVYNNRNILRMEEVGIGA